MVVDLNHVLEQIEKDKGIPRESLIEAIEAAMLSAARKKLGFYGDLETQYNPELGEVELFQFKTVAKEIEDDQLEMTLEEAKKLDPDADFGDEMGVKVDANILGRIAAQTAKQVIIQKMRDAERGVVYEEYKDKVGQVLSGVVRRLERGNLIIDLGKTEAVIPYKEQVPSESFKVNDRIQAFFFQLNATGRGHQIMLSRKHPGFVKALFEMEVPEITEGVVQLKGCARHAGIRSKIAVYTDQMDVDPLGACVGMRGSRVQSIVQELRGERIDIVLWDQDIAKFVCNAIKPAEVSKVILNEDEKSMEIIVPDDQLSLAIGKKGQNVRLAANLTGWGIDIYSETKMEEMAKIAKAQLVEDLGIDEALATILYSHAFRSVDEIISIGLEEFLEIPGLDKQTMGEIFNRAEEVVESRPIDQEEADEDDQDDEIEDQTEGGELAENQGVDQSQDSVSEDDESEGGKADEIVNEQEDKTESESSASK